MIGGRGKARHDETLLSAYLDGELDVRARLEVELWLAEDAEARRVLERLRGADRSVRAALSTVLDEKPPAALLRRIEAAAAGRRRIVSGPGTLSRRPLTWALAVACLLLLAVLPAVWFWSAERSRQDEAAARQSAASERDALEASLSQALQLALERTLSGETLPWHADPAGVGAGEILPVRTYKSRSGQWCREYRIKAVIEGEAVQERGIACRVETESGAPAHWERKVLFLDDTGLPIVPHRPT
jgi:surface antigen